MSWFIEQNEWTIPIFILSVIVDFWAAREVDKHVHNPGLYLGFLSFIVFNLITCAVYLKAGTLFNISPIGSMVTIVIICMGLIDTYNEANEIDKLSPLRAFFHQCLIKIKRILQIK